MHKPMIITAIVFFSSLITAQEKEISNAIDTLIMHKREQYEARLQRRKERLENYKETVKQGEKLDRKAMHKIYSKPSYAPLLRELLPLGLSKEYEIEELDGDSIYPQCRYIRIRKIPALLLALQEGNFAEAQALLDHKADAYAFVPVNELFYDKNRGKSELWVDLIKHCFERKQGVEALAFLIERSGLDIDKTIVIRNYDSNNHAWNVLQFFIHCHTPAPIDSKVKGTEKLIRLLFAKGSHLSNRSLGEQYWLETEYRHTQTLATIKKIMETMKQEQEPLLPLLLSLRADKIDKSKGFQSFISILPKELHEQLKQH